MTETGRASDLGLGLAITFGVVAVLAALATAATSYVSVINDDAGLQTIGGLAFAAALLAAGLSVAAVHLFE
jgi:hypothetical protein